MNFKDFQGIYIYIYNLDHREEESRNSTGFFRNSAQFSTWRSLTPKKIVWNPTTFLKYTMGLRRRVSNLSLCIQYWLNQILTPGIAKYLTRQLVCERSRGRPLYLFFCSLSAADRPTGHTHQISNQEIPGVSLISFFAVCRSLPGLLTEVTIFG